MSQVLCIGLTCLDLVQILDKYPLEDSDQRCKDARWQRGGNASNNCSVFSQINIPCSYIGTLAQDLTSKFIEEDFKEFGIDISKCVVISNESTPLSTVILTKQSRTIVHYPGTLPELSYDNLINIDYTKYKWIHFEGRNETVIERIMEHINNISNNRPKLSVELEKPRESLKRLIHYADVIFISKEYSHFCGWTNPGEAINSISCKKGSTVICAWGEKGAWAKINDVIYHSPSFPPKEIIDTLGAGDTFVAGYIAGQIKNYSIEKSLEFACKLAGYKISMFGFKGLFNFDVV